MQPAQPYTNGAAHHHAPRLALVKVPPRDPFEGVLAIDNRATWVAAVAFAGAIAIHGAAAVRTALIDPVLLDWSSRTGAAIEKRLNQDIDVALAKETPPPPPPPIEDKKEEEDKPIDNNPPPTQVREDNPYKDVTQASKPAAEAGQILGAKDELDFTGDAFVTGSGAVYTGGSTSSQGKNQKPVVTKTNGNGNGPADAPPQAATGPDRSRSISLAGSSDWKCPWPSEADAEQIDESYVTIEVAVGTDGKAQKVTVVQDPGFGFAREARSCALRQTYNAALDRDGKPIAATKKFRVRFER